MKHTGSLGLPRACNYSILNIHYQPMICLGILFGCKISSFESYLVTVLVIIGTVVVLRLLCYIIYRLVTRSSTPGEADESDQSDSDTAVVQMQLQNRAGNVHLIM